MTSRRTMWHYSLLVCLLILTFVSHSDAFCQSWSTTTKRHSPARVATTSLSLYRSIQEAIAEAQRICAEDPSCQACNVAWDIVEELEAADSHRSAEEKTSGVISNNADLVALLSSFDLLSQKIEGKMDQLSATTNKLQQLGANDPAVAELGARAQTMKEHLEYVRKYLHAAKDGN